MSAAQPPQQEEPTENVAAIPTDRVGDNNQILSHFESSFPRNGVISVDFPSVASPWALFPVANNSGRSLSTMNNFLSGESSIPQRRGSNIIDNGTITFDNYVTPTIRSGPSALDPVRNVLNSTAYGTSPLLYNGGIVNHPTLIFTDSSRFGTIALNDQSMEPLQLDTEQVVFDNDDDIDEFAEIVSWTTTPPSVSRHRMEETPIELEATTQCDEATAVAYPAPPIPPSGPIPTSLPTAVGSDTHVNDIWMCKETYEAERKRDIDLWLQTLFPPNATAACSGDLLAVEREKLSVMKKLTLLTAMGKLYLVKKKDAIMDTIEDLHGANISIASLFNHGKRIVVQVDGRYDAFVKLQSFLFPDKLLYDRMSTHNVVFCPIQHHVQEVELSSLTAKPCRGMDFAYGGLGEIHRKDACTNAVKSRTDVGEWFQIIANGERKCLKSGEKVSDMQHGHLIVKVADKAPQGRFHGFLFGIENSRPLKYTLGDGLKFTLGRFPMGMFDAGHGPAASKGAASVSGGWKRDLFINMLGHQPDNIGGVRLHLDRHQIDSFYQVYATMAEDRHQYETLLYRLIGDVPRV